jgi:hypothetical protein
VGVVLLSSLLYAAMTSLCEGDESAMIQLKV